MSLVWNMLSMRYVFDILMLNIYCLKFIIEKRIRELNLGVGI